jgi:hypothetical protein
LRRQSRGKSHRESHRERDLLTHRSDSQKESLTHLLGLWKNKMIKSLESSPPFFSTDHEVRKG